MHNGLGTSMKCDQNTWHHISPYHVLKFTFVSKFGGLVAHFINSFIDCFLMFENKRSDETMVDELGTVPREWSHAPAQQNQLK